MLDKARYILQEVTISIQRLVLHFIEKLFEETSSAVLLVAPKLIVPKICERAACTLQVLLQRRMGGSIFMKLWPMAAMV